MFRLVPDTLTGFSPARVWIGLENSDDVGIRFDLRAEVYRNTTLIGSGQLVSVPGGSSGFNHAKLHSIRLEPLGPDPVPFGIADTLSIKVSVRNACTGSGKNSGTARLWFNDAAANSGFDATIAETTRHYFLSTDFALTMEGGATKQSLTSRPARSAGCSCRSGPGASLSLDPAVLRRASSRSGT